MIPKYFVEKVFYDKNIPYRCSIYCITAHSKAMNTIPVAYKQYSRNNESRFFFYVLVPHSLDNL